MRTLLLAVGAMAASAVVAVAGLAVVRWAVPLEVLRANNDVAGNYLQSLGTLYAVLLAFVVFVVWSQFDEARGSVEREANEIADLWRIARALPPHIRAQLLEGMRAYARAVVEEEWLTMARGEESPVAATLLDDLWDTFAAFEPSGARCEALYAEALARFDDLSDARTHRLICCRARLPSTLWALLLVGAVVTVGSMYFFGLERFWPHALMTAAMAASVAFVLYVILDLDNPFWGDWRVGPEPIGRLFHREPVPELALYRD